jgi:hypothetical protein
MLSYKMLLISTGRWENPNIPCFHRVDEIENCPRLCSINVVMN